jgi:hypothetical protein
MPAMDLRRSLRSCALLLPLVCSPGLLLGCGSDGATAGTTSNGGGGSSSGSGGKGSCEEPLFAGGKLDATAYLKLAENLSSPDAIAFRYGGGCDAESLPGPDASPPHQCERAHQQLEVQPNVFFSYELGTHDLTKDDYSMTDGQILSLADQAADPGVSHFSSVIMGQGVFGESAQKTWQYYGGFADIAFGDKNGSNDPGVALNGGPLGRPVAMARGYNVWSEDALVVLDSGVVAAAGTYTGRTYLYFKFPAEKRPLSVAVTTNNEFALFTVWDTKALKSQVAVVALGSGGMFWNDFTELYPGFTSFGMYKFAKILGYVDLPGIAAATEISASSDFHICHELPYACWYAGHKQQSELSLSDEANRQTFVGDTFVDGTNIGAYSQAGFAAVIAPAERKLVVLDLKPLFAYTKKMYFGALADFEKTKTVGDAPDQWPYSFDFAPDFAPTVAQVIDLPTRPTAVKTSPLGGQLYAATVEGTLHVYDVGTLAGRHATAGSTDGAVKEVSHISVGANVTAIAHMKHGFFASSEPGIPRDAMMVLSRAQRRIDWVHAEGSTVEIDRTLRDDRLVDPIALEDADNHGTESFIVSVADHEGKKVLNYRYGPVTYYTNGGERFDMCEDGKGAFEFGGALDVGGKPFSLSVSNTP